jgi:LPS-assembly lipoprotein
MRHLLLLLFCLILSACGFHLQSEMALAPPLHTLYFKTAEPYGVLSRTLQDSLTASHVKLVATAAAADAVLEILSENSSQVFLSVNGTQQTRQYNLIVTVEFDITDRTGRVIIPPQSLSESRTITVQSNQILGSSNEANLFYLQMRRTLAYAIMNRIASKEVTMMINAAHLSP